MFLRTFFQSRLQFSQQFICSYCFSTKYYKLTGDFICASIGAVPGLNCLILIQTITLNQIKLNQIKVVNELDFYDMIFIVPKIKRNNYTIQRKGIVAVDSKMKNHNLNSFLLTFVSISCTCKSSNFIVAMIMDL